MLFRNGRLLFSLGRLARKCGACCGTFFAFCCGGPGATCGHPVGVPGKQSYQIIWSESDSRYFNSFPVGVYLANRSDSRAGQATLGVAGCGGEGSFTGPTQFGAEENTYTVGNTMGNGSITFGVDQNSTDPKTKLVTNGLYNYSLNPDIGVLHRHVVYADSSHLVGVFRIVAVGQRSTGGWAVQGTMFYGNPAFGGSVTFSASASLQYDGSCLVGMSMSANYSGRETFPSGAPSPSTQSGSFSAVLSPTDFGRCVAAASSFDPDDARALL